MDHTLAPAREGAVDRLVGQIREGGLFTGQFRQRTGVVRPGQRGPGGGGACSAVLLGQSKIGGFEIIEKNSVNGFHASGFRKFLENNMDKSCYIVCGDCTDICVLNFCLSLKTFFNEINKSAEILVPLNMIETFHAEKHDRSFANISALSVMETNGIKLVGGIAINE